MTDPNEAALDTALQRIEGIRIESLPTQTTGAVEYSFIGDLLDDPRARLAELFEKLWRQIAGYADVRTSVACTTVAWRGNIETAVSGMATRAALQEHSQTVAKNIVRRTQWLRILIASTAVATRVAAATANPVAIPSAFRAGWKLAAELETVLGPSTAM